MQDGDRAWNRDQFTSMAYPQRVLFYPEASWEGEYNANYKDWRKKTWWQPRHWMFPHQWLHFRNAQLLSTWKPVKVFCESFEFADTFFDTRKARETSIILSVYRHAIGILLTEEPSRVMIKSWDYLDSKFNLEEVFTTYFTRSVPGDPPGEHPPVHLLWHLIIKLIREKVEKFR